MFSRAEREFLRSLVETDRVDATGARELPNPSYRRKLLWGIRQKVQGTLSDLELLVAAARVDPRVLPSSVGAGPPSASSAPVPPVFSDPVFVGLVDWWRKATRRSPKDVRNDEPRRGPGGRLE